jgi:DNA-binding NarL/FixJ family response regulator
MGLGMLGSAIVGGLAGAGKGMVAVGEAGMKAKIQEEHMLMQEQLARDRQEWMDQRAEAKRLDEGKRFTEESDKIKAGKVASANAEYDTAKAQLEAKNQKGDLTVHIGELEKNRAEFISSIKLSGRENIEAMKSAGVLGAKDYTNALISQEKDDTANRRLDIQEQRNADLMKVQMMQAQKSLAQMGKGDKDKAALQDAIRLAMHYQSVVEAKPSDATAKARYNEAMAEVAAITGKMPEVPTETVKVGTKTTDPITGEERTETRDVKRKTNSTPAPGQGPTREQLIATAKARGYTDQQIAAQLKRVGL